MLKEKLKNGTFMEYDSKDLENYWIPRIFGLEILSNSIEILDITAGDSAGDKYKIGFKWNWGKTKFRSDTCSEI